jgi:hypothetical protein
MSDGEYFPRVFHGSRSAEFTRRFDPPFKNGKNQGGGRGDLRFDLAH